MSQPVKPPFSDTIWDERETWSRDRIETFQLDALRRQLQRVGERSAHYKRVFADAGFHAGDLKSFADLRRLPFSRKSDYVAGLSAEPPFGNFAAVVPGEAVRVHFSSGTTARPAPVLWTQADIARWADIVRNDAASGRDVFVYFKHEEEGKGPEFARLLMERLGL